MEIYSTEEQQVDAIKQFWKDYGTSIIGGAVIGFGGLYGWNYYSDHQVAQAQAASEAFQAASVNSASMLTAAESFAKNHSQQGYQSLLDLLVAKAAVDAGELGKAEEALKRVLAAKPEESLVMVATLRLARVQAEQGQLATAITTLDSVSAPSFAAQRDELKGDF